MGAPVKIDTLARNLIKLSGYTPDVDTKSPTPVSAQAKSFTKKS